MATSITDATPYLARVCNVEAIHPHACCFLCPECNAASRTCIENASDVWIGNVNVPKMTTGSMLQDLLL
jgi:hypothetical protein